MTHTLRLNVVAVVAAMVFGSVAHVGQAAPLVLPFTETFASSSLDAGWKVDASTGNTIEVKDGSLEIRARMNTYAHVERPLDVDFVRATCGIEPAPAISWCTSLFVYWDAGNWCQIGIIARNGGCYYVLEMIDGKPHEYELGQCPFGSLRYVGIELAADCIRYLVGEDGVRFSDLAVRRRPDEYRSVPRLLVVGKGHGGEAGYIAADLNNDYKEPGEFGVSRVRRIEVRETERGRLRTTEAEQKAWESEGLDLLGEEVLARPSDPTYESVLGPFPAMKRPREVVGVKDHPFDVGVAFDGTLQFGGAKDDDQYPTAFLEIGDPPYRFGSGKAPCTRRLLNGWMPVVILNDKHDELDIEQTVLGYTKDFSPDEPLFALIGIKVANTGDAARQVKLVLRVQPASQKSPPWITELDVAAHAEISTCVSVPYAATEASAVTLTSSDFQQRLTEVTRYWEKLISPASRFEIPEQRIHDAYRAWLAYNFLNVDKRNGVYHVCDGSGFYEEVYGYSAALYSHALDLMGYHDLSRLYMDSLLTFQQPDGLLCVNYGATDMGTVMSVIADHYLMTGDDDWLKQVAPRMIAMRDWIVSHRQESMKHIHGKRAVVYGLVRWRPYCDHELPAFDYYCNAYLCSGMFKMAGVLGRVGMNAEAERFAKEAEAFHKDILVSMDAAVITHDRMKMLPIMPESHTLLKETNYTANGYYGLLASCLLETGIPACNDPRADLLVDMLRRKGGLVLGVSQFFDMIDHAYSYGYWMTCLNRDEIERVILGLYSSMAYGMTRDTYAAVECTRIRSGENWWTLPHTYSNTQQLTLLRNMMVREVGDDLFIGQAIPRHWLADGRRVAGRELPTAFGPVSFVIDSKTNEGVIRVTLRPPTRGRHKAIRLRLRHPAGLVIKSATCSPKTELSFKGEDIQFSSLNKPVEITVQY